MDVIKALQPAHATTRYLRNYGDELVCVCYRHDPETRQRVTTVELIADRGTVILTTPTEKRRRAAIRKNPQQSVGQALVRIDYREMDLRNRVKAAGGIWLPKSRV